jgi:hypothetical protein
VEREGGVEAVEERSIERQREVRQRRHSSFEEHAARGREARGRSGRGQDGEAPRTQHEDGDRTGSPSFVPVDGGAPPAPLPVPQGPQLTLDGSVAVAAGQDPAHGSTPAVAHPTPFLSGLASRGGPASQAPVAGQVAGSEAVRVSAVAEPRGIAEARREASVRPAPQHSDKSAVAERAAEVIRQIRVHLANGMKRVELELQPQELGKLSIQLAVGRGQVRAIVRAESAETLQLLERHLPELRATLEASGLNADSFEMHLGFSDGRNGPGRRGERNAHRIVGHPQAHARHQTNTGALAPHASPTLSTGGDGLLDTYA